MSINWDEWREVDAARTAATRSLRFEPEGLLAIVSRMKRRAAELRAALDRVEPMREELARLEKAIAAAESCT